MAQVEKAQQWFLKLDAAEGKPKSSINIDSEDALARQLDELIRRSNGSAMLLYGEDDSSLTFAVNEEHAVCCLEPGADGDAYRCAAAERPIEGMSEFNVGGTLTEIPLARCIDKHRLKDIVLHYYRTRHLLATMRWEVTEP